MLTQPISHVCLVCTSSLEGYRPNRRWCDGCYRDIRNRRKIDVRRSQGAGVIGLRLNCKECGAEFEKKHKRQFYCPPCSELSARDYLPSQRARVIAYQSARNARRRQEDPAYAISCRMSAGINNSLKDGKGGRSWEKLVGYSIVDLTVHLERQFLPGMTWSNRDKWHIDHIVPLASFEFTSPEDDGFKAAWALTNLRPLWSEANVRKGGKRQHLL